MRLGSSMTEKKIAHEILLRRTSRTLRKRGFLEGHELNWVRETKVMKGLVLSFNDCLHLNSI